MNIVTVYIARGDQGNIGGGAIIGIFKDHDLAMKTVQGRGSMDCGGDGYVEDGKAVEDEDGNLYLLSQELGDKPIELDKTHPRGWWCNPEDPDWYVKQEEALAAIQRNDLGLTPAETTEIFGMTDRIHIIKRLREITCVPVYRESRKIECYVKTDGQPTEEVLPPQVDYYRKPTLKEAMEIHQRIERVDADL